MTKKIRTVSREINTWSKLKKSGLKSALCAVPLFFALSGTPADAAPKSSDFQEEAIPTQIDMWEKIKHRESDERELVVLDSLEAASHALKEAHKITILPYAWLRSELGVPLNKEGKEHASLSLRTGAFVKVDLGKNTNLAFAPVVNISSDGKLSPLWIGQLNTQVGPLSFLFGKIVNAHIATHGDYIFCPDGQTPNGVQQKMGNFGFWWKVGAKLGKTSLEVGAIKGLSGLAYEASLKYTKDHIWVKWSMEINEQGDWNLIATIELAGVKHSFLLSPHAVINSWAVKVGKNLVAKIDAEYDFQKKDLTYLMASLSKTFEKGKFTLAFDPLKKEVLLIHVIQF